MSAQDLFNDVKDVDKLVARYHVKLQVHGVLVGGVPSNPSVIRSWIKAKLELGDAALEELVNQTIAERNGPMTADEKLDVVMQSDSVPSVNGFKRNPEGVLSYEGRCFKSAIKEAANSSFPGTDFPGKKSITTISPRKGLLSTLEERVFVPEILIPLGVNEPSRTEERVKHVLTPMGPRSAINIVEVIDRPVIETIIEVHDDFLPREAWAKIWRRLESIGIGADRGRSDGAFELLDWSKVN